MTNIMIVMVMLLFCGFLLGYRYGKSEGFSSGYAAGEVSRVLKLREQSQELGCCILCKSPLLLSELLPIETIHLNENNQTINSKM